MITIKLVLSILFSRPVSTTMNINNIASSMLNNIVETIVDNIKDNIIWQLHSLLTDRFFKVR